MAAKDSARGKALELHVGRMFGGRRRRNGEGIGFDDCVDEHGFELPVSIECKSYAQLQLRQDWIDQARRNAGSRWWAVVQRPRGSKTIYATVDLNWLHALCVAAGVVTPPPNQIGGDIEWRAGPLTRRTTFPQSLSGESSEIA